MIEWFLDQNINIWQIVNAFNYSNILGITQKYLSLKPAINDSIPINKEKFENIKKLLNYVVLPERTTFY
jgi:hypothetical protein